MILSPDLDRIRVRFATFRERSVDERATFADSLTAVRADERVLLDTCHRVELVSVDDADRPEASVQGVEAVRRVFEVVAGFDSAVVAEEQLLGQVRSAYENALRAGSTGPILNELFRRALGFGRRVRSHARPGADRSLADRGARWLLAQLDSASRVTVVGSGEMGRRVARDLATARHAVTVVSRSGERSQRIVESLPGSGHRSRVGQITAELLADSGGLAFAVRPSEPMLRVDHLRSRGALPILDLSTPAAVDPAAGAMLGEHLMGIDRLGQMGVSAPVLDHAAEQRLRREMATEVERFTNWLAGRQASSAIALLHGEAEAVRRRHLDRLRRRAGLAPEQLEAVEAASAAMVGELLHGPSVELSRGGADADVVRRLFRLGS